MLVLSRKINESVIIDDRIKVTVIEIRGDRIKLGFEAPGEVPIHREEVRQRLAAEQLASESRDFAMQHA
jgi:carbon storage regulator